MSDYVSMATALARLDISRTLFEAEIRPHVTAYPVGKRAVRFSWREIEEAVAALAAEHRHEGAGMFFRRTVADALDHTWRVRWSKAKGAYKKAQLVKVVKQDIGDKPLNQVNYNVLEEWIAELRDKDQAVATIKTKVSCLMAALKTVKPKGWIKTLPDVPYIGELSNEKLRWLNEDEEARLLKACGCQRAVVERTMQDVIVFLIDTGARVGELLKVREDSLSIRRGVTYVEFRDRKKGDDLHIPLTRRAEGAARRLLASRYWRLRVRGVRESAKRHASAQSWVTHRISEIAKHAKMPDVTAHTLRHTCGSRLAQRGVSIYKIQKWLGQQDIRMTKRYSHLGPSDLDDVVGVLERVPENVTKLDDYR